MSPLDMISTAAAARNEPSTSDNPPMYPIIIDAERIFPLLKPVIDEDETSVLHRSEGWKISEHDCRIAEISTRFHKKLKRKLRNPKSLLRSEFLNLFNWFLDQNSQTVGLPIGIDASDPDYMHRAIEKLGFLITCDVADLILNACVFLDLWDVLESLILNKVVCGESSSTIVEKLVEKRRSDTLCQFLKHVNNIRSSDLLLILKHFLSPRPNPRLAVIRKEWENQALLSIEKATGERSSIATQAAVNLAMAHDGFSSSELCLHYVFGSKNIEGLELSAPVAELGGEEVAGLVRYLGKWLRKYERFPLAFPCPSAASSLGLECCRWVPSLESVVKCLGLVLNQHFLDLVLNAQLHEELLQIEGVVRSLECEARLCSSIKFTIENMRKDCGRKGGNNDR